MLHKHQDLWRDTSHFWSYVLKEFDIQRGKGKEKAKGRKSKINRLQVAFGIWVPFGLDPNLG